MKTGAALLLGAVAFAGLAGLFLGGTPVAPARVINGLIHPHAMTQQSIIVWQLRLPRVVVAALVGASLGCAGTLLQGMLRNPLADPYLTGVSAGSAAAIVIAVSAGVSPAFVPAAGFLAGIATALLVAALARRGTGIDANRLILAGVSLSSLFAAIITLVLFKSQTVEASGAIIAWLAGSVAGRSWRDVATVVPYVAAGLGLAVVALPALDALRLGELRARALGVRVERAQWIILAATSLLAAASVVLAGTVGFVGLIGPHIARRLVPGDARRTLPAAALAGAGLTVLADTASRALLAPSELPIGVLLAFAGVPIFLVLYLRERRAFE